MASKVRISELNGVFVVHMKDFKTYHVSLSKTPHGFSEGFV